MGVQSMDVHTMTGKVLTQRYETTPDMEDVSQLVKETLLAPHGLLVLDTLDGAVLVPARSVEYVVLNRDDVTF